MKIIIIIYILISIILWKQYLYYENLSNSIESLSNDIIISNLDNIPGYGFFSMGFVLLNHYIYCKLNKINFKIKSDNWLFKYKEGWNDYYINKELIYNTPNNNINYNLKNILGEYTYKMYMDAIKELFIFNPTINKKIEEIKLKFNLINNKYDSIFIRRGDKLAIESKYISEKEYIELLLQKNPNCNTIFLQTDDYNAYINLKKYIDDNNLIINIYTLCDKNNFCVIVNNKQKSRLNNAVINNDNNKHYLSSIIKQLNNTKSVEDMTKDEIYNHTLEMLIGIDIVNHSNICILDLQSNVSRYIKLSHNNSDNVFDIINPNYKIDYDKIIKPWENI